MSIQDTTRSAPGIARRTLGTTLALSWAVAAAQGVPIGSAQAHRTGAFGPVLPWPIVPIHAVLLPDGRVMSYGTDASGAQGAQLVYAVWDPALGKGLGAHMVLPNGTGTDIFCSAQTVVPGTGLVLLVGGDKTVGGVRNHSVEDVTFFDPARLSLVASAHKLAQPRWYASALPLASGEVLVLGGRASPTEPVTTPEIYHRAGGWRSLPGARQERAFALDGYNFNYPRAWEMPRGGVFMMSHTGETWRLRTSGPGDIARAALTLPRGHAYLPALMIAPGRVLALREGRQVLSIDLRGMTPAAETLPPIDQMRYHANATVLADGGVLINGGSAQDNQAVDVAYGARIWRPETGRWVAAASAAKMRLYHSVSLLLPDGTVLTGGGGVPGPQTQLNAEIYYPPYLYREDGSGQPAVRPVIMSAPSSLDWGERFHVRADTLIDRITLVRMGSASHALNLDQRFFELRSLRPGATRTVLAPDDPRSAPPGDYLLFVFNRAGTPSLAKVVRLGA